MSSHIPPELNTRMNDDPFYKQCCITGRAYEKIDRHHNLQFAGKQAQEYWAILPLARSVHDRMNKRIKELCDWIMLNRATDEELKPYCRAVDYIAMRARLNEKFGQWAPGILPPPLPVLSRDNCRVRP
jgi:hypothetical protein